MGELRSLNTVLGAIYDPGSINNAFRATSKELQDFLAWLMFGDNDAGGGVAGFSASETSALNVTVTRGGGLIYTAGAPSPASKWAWVYSGASVVKAITAHHLTKARVDLISVSWTQIPDTPVSVGYEGGSPAVTQTQRGCQATLTVTAGGTVGAGDAPGAWAEKPATPAGSEALWYVYVPATSGALVMVDVRRHLPGPKERPYNAPLITYTDVDTNAVLRTISARKADNADTAFASLEGWDVTEDWPYYSRAKAASGDIGAGTALYPMMIPAGRTWYRAVPWLGVTVDSGANPMTATIAGPLVLTRVGTTAIGYVQSVGIPVETRGLEVVAANLRYKVTTAFDATFTAKKVDLIHVAADGTITTIGTANLTLNGVHGSVQTLALSLAGGTPTIAEGDMLFAQLVLTSTGTGTAVGSVQLGALDVQFKEGRA